MPERFHVDRQLIDKARKVLGDRRRLYWIMGGSCTGKSTVAQMIAGKTGISTVDLDTYIYDRFMPRYQEDRHPASKAWFGAENSLEWVLSLSWEQFDALNRASNAEFLDLLADELAAVPAAEALIIDGGLTHPSVLARVVSPSRVVCLEAADEIRYRIWETAEERAFMKQWVHDLPDGPAKWQKFLYFDKMMAETMVAESRAAGVQVIGRLEETPADGLADSVIEAWSMVNCE